MLLDGLLRYKSATCGLAYFVDGLDPWEQYFSAQKKEGDQNPPNMKFPHSHTGSFLFVPDTAR